MSGNLWMFSDMLDDEDIEMQKHDFITLYQGADYYGLGLKVFTRMAREAGSVYGLTSGATRYPRTRTMRFLFWHRQFSLADTVPL